MKGGVPNIRPRAQNRPSKDSNLAHLMNIVCRF